MAEETKNTEQAGAVPADKGKQPEAPTGKDAEAKKEEKSDSSSEEKLPFDQHPKWKEARTAAKKLNDLLKANNLEDPDDLVELIQKGKAVKGKLHDLNQLDKLIERDKLLSQYEEYWATEKEKKRREAEDPEQTIARLEEKLKEKEKHDKQKDSERAQAEEARRAIQSYDREVKDLVSELELPKEQGEFFNQFLGVGNPFNDIDITDRKAIKKMFTDAVKKKEAYDQAIIAAYLKGKKEIPAVASTSEGAPEKKPEKITMRNAKSIFAESLLKKLQGG